MSIYRSSSLAFLAGLGITCLISSPLALDQQLSIRYLILGLTLASCFFFFLKEIKTAKLQADVFTVSYGLYIFWTLCSNFWANTVSESLFASGRDLLGFLSLACCHKLLVNDEVYFKKGIRYTIIVCSVIVLIVSVFQIIKAGTVSHENMYQVTGLNGHKNLLGSFLFLSLIFLLINTGVSKSVEILSVVLIAATIGLLLILQSKAVWAALLIVPAVFFLFPKNHSGANSKKSVFQLVILNLVFLMAVLFLLPVLLDYLGSLIKGGSLSAVEERIQLWKKTLSIIRDHTWFGVGAGNWPVHFPDQTLRGIWRAEDLNVTFQRPHNDVLWIISETGLIGAFFYFFSLISLLVPGLGSSNKQTKLLAGFLAGYLLIAFCDFPRERIEHVLLLNILLAFIYHELKKENSVYTFGSIPPGSLYPLAGLLLSALLAVFGYLRQEGEYYTNELYEARTLNQADLMIKNGELANSFVYRTDPFTVPLAWYMGNAKASQNELEEAAHYFEEARQLTPYNRHVLNDLASAYSLINKNETAISLYRETLRISPRFDDPALNLTAIYINNKEFAKAQNCLDSLKHDSDRRSGYQKLLNEIKSK